MRRDWECIRTILLKLEEEGGATGHLAAIECRASTPIPSPTTCTF
jgi:hypothetical protein